MTLPMPWKMPELPEGWIVSDAQVDSIGYWLGRRTDVPNDDAISIRLEHRDPLAHARVAVRTLPEFMDFLAALGGITPHLRHGMHIETNYY